MKWIMHGMVFCVLFSGCSSLNDSLELGGGIGLVVGAASMAGAEVGTRARASLGKIAAAAEVGSLLGGVVSLLVHRAVENARKSEQAEVPEMYFGDLPPSPFVTSKHKAEVR